MLEALKSLLVTKVVFTSVIFTVLSAVMTATESIFIETGTQDKCFVVIVSASLIASPKQKTLVQAPSFYSA
jgi:hypothetical protein